MWWSAFAVLAVHAAVVAALQNITIQAQDTTDISYSGNWTNNNDYCTSTRFASNQGDELTFNFNGVAIYAIGTVDCGWSGLLSISLDGEATLFNRRNCTLLPVGGPDYICEYPWIARTGLDPSTTHTLTITLTGPPIAQASDGHIIADLRYLIYTIDPPATSSTGSESTQSATSSSSSHGSNTGAIVGGVIGGLLGFAIAAIIVFLGCRRRQTRRPTASAIAPGHALPPSTWAPSPSGMQDSPTGLMYSPTNEKIYPFPQPEYYATLPASAFPSEGSRSPVSSTNYDQGPWAGPSSPISSPGHRMSTLSSSSSPDTDLVSKVTTAVLAAMREETAPPAYQETHRP